MATSSPAGGAASSTAAGSEASCALATGMSGVMSDIRNSTLTRLRIRRLIHSDMAHLRIHVGPAGTPDMAVCFTREVMASMKVVLPKVYRICDKFVGKSIIVM